MTHADPRCVYGCVVLNRTITEQLLGSRSPLQNALDTVATEAPDELVSPLRSIPMSDPVTEFGLTPYVVDTLGLALHHGLCASSTAHAIIGAVNEGGDADTTAAIAGAVAGARHGASTIPDSWLDALDREEEIRTLADKLWASDIASPSVDEFSLPDLADHPGRCGQCGMSWPSYDDPSYCPSCGKEW